MRRYSALMLLSLLLPPTARALAPVTYLPPESPIPVDKVAIAEQPKDAPVVMSADAMGADEPNNIVIARGNVEVMQGDYILTADQITYYRESDMVVAEGHVVMLQPTGDVFFSDKAELKDAMKRGVIDNFKARFSDGSVLVAEKAIKRSSSKTELQDAAYTPCKVCENLSPFWQVNAEEAKVDDETERVTYRDATMDMFGIPVFYTPYLSHPTPDATAKSGFLGPVYANNPNLGTLVKVPYYWRISPDKDVVITPWLITDIGPLLEWDYRQLRDKGSYHIRGSATYPQEINGAGREVSGHEFRGHIFAQGDEAVADNTYVGFDIQRASDDTYLRRYRFGDDEALFSRLYGEYAQQRNFALAEGVAIQGLRSTDSYRTTPLALPILQGYYETPAYENGMKLHLSADAQMLSRVEGVDQRRVSVSPGATLPYVTEGGQIFTATVNLRQDIYSTSNLATSGEDTTTTRTLPQAALEWRYPLIRSDENGSLIVEPIVLGVLQPNGSNPDDISNEDSRLLELSDLNLFSINRMPGLDLYDSGSRVAYGVRGQYYALNGVTFDGMLGQNYDFNSDTPFPNSTRPGEQFSDYIGRIAATYDPVTLTYRFALEKNDATFNRNEIGVSFSKPWLSLYTSYRSIKNNRYLNDSQEGLISATVPLSDEWSVYGNGRRDFELGQMVAANGGIIYKNECFTMMIDALRMYARDRDIEPTTQYTVRFGFKNLGEFGGD